MPASLASIRDSMDVHPTPQDKGLTYSPTITAYDNGVITVDGTPMDDTDNWLSAAEHLVAKLNEFRRQTEARRKSRA